MRILGLDLSLNPGIAAIKVNAAGKPHLIAAEAMTTAPADGDALRAHAVESFIAQFTYKHRPFDAVAREHFTSSRSKRATQAVYMSWAAADRALHMYDYAIEAELTPSTVKKLVTGNGRAEKDEVAAAVVKMLGLAADYKWARGYDDSDACAVALAYLIERGVIK